MELGAGDAPILSSSEVGNGTGNYQNQSVVHAIPKRSYKPFLDSLFEEDATTIPPTPPPGLSMFASNEQEIISVDESGGINLRVESPTFQPPAQGGLGDISSSADNNVATGDKLGLVGDLGVLGSPSSFSDMNDIFLQGSSALAPLRYNKATVSRMTGYLSPSPDDIENIAFKGNITNPRSKTPDYGNTSTFDFVQNRPVSAQENLIGLQNRNLTMQDNQTMRLTSSLSLNNIGSNPNIATSASNDSVIKNYTSNSVTRSSPGHSDNVLAASINSTPRDNFQSSESDSSSSSVEQLVAKTCRDILLNAADNSLKAVELANTLRARVGTDILACIRERWGGLLALLERYPDFFQVLRVPKNDKVRLILGSYDRPITESIPQIQNQSRSSKPAANRLNSSQHLDRRGLSSGTPLSYGNDSHSRISPGPDNMYNANELFDTHPMMSSSMSTSQQMIGGGRLVRNMAPSAYYHVDSCGITMNDKMGGNGVHGSPNVSVTRCLHVGNVPPALTEYQLMKEFESFGQIEGLKLISQRNGSRRFAFITYRTIQQAIAAKQSLSKIHPWKSAISFAHKEFQSNNPNNNHRNSQNNTYNAHHQNHNIGVGGNLSFVNQQQPQRHQRNMMETNEVNSMQSNVTQNSNDAESSFLQNVDFINGLRQVSQSVDFANFQGIHSGQNSIFDINGLTSNGVVTLQRSQSADVIGNLLHNGYSAPPASGKLTTTFFDSIGKKPSQSNIDKTSDHSHSTGIGMNVSNNSSSSNSNNSSVNSDSKVDNSSTFSRGTGLKHGSINYGNFGSVSKSSNINEDQNVKSAENERFIVRSGNLEKSSSVQFGNDAAFRTNSFTQSHNVNLANNHGDCDGRMTVNASNPVLKRLCDDTYVPTQPWPVDVEQDKPFFDAIVVQLQQLGGSITLSKLRGFLRNRLDASDNIKSVPLKAMLAAYSQVFIVQNNHVSLKLEWLPNLQPNHIQIASQGIDLSLSGKVPIGDASGLPMVMNDLQHPLMPQETVRMHDHNNSNNFSGEMMLNHSSYLNNMLG